MEDERDALHRIENCVRFHPEFTLEEIVQSWVEQCYRFNKSNVSKTATDLGVSRPFVYRRLNELATLKDKDEYRKAQVQSRFTLSKKQIRRRDDRIKRNAQT